MANSDQPTTTLSPSSNLLCQESPIASLDHQDLGENVPATEGNDDEEEYVQLLFNREISGNGLQLQVRDSSDVISYNWIKEARVEAIQYIYRTGVSFEFRIQTIFLAVTYVDRFLSRTRIKDESNWAIRLLAIACLSLAAKMEECKVILLSEFWEDNYKFESREIKDTELLVLDRLDWRMGLVTPFEFTNYFVSKFCQNSSMGDVVSRVAELILMAVKEDENLIHHKPSAIAAAATLLISDPRLTRESLEHNINALSSRDFLRIEDVFTFYNQMKEMDIENFRSSNSILSPLLSPIQLQTTEALQNPSVTSAVSTERKSLTFNESDEDSELPENKRRC